LIIDEPPKPSTGYPHRGDGEGNAFGYTAVRNRTDQMKIKQLIIISVCTAGWSAFATAVFATDLNGSWATDVSACSKVFVKKGGSLSFAQDSEEFGGGFILEGDKVRGQMQTCTIRARKEKGNVVHMIAACANDIMASNIQFSAKIIDDNTIARIFPEMGDEFSIKYARCPK
jgi:hypothetical protein